MNLKRDENPWGSDVSADERLKKVRAETDPNVLEMLQQHYSTQPSVKKAIESRIRRLCRDAQRKFIEGRSP